MFIELGIGRGYLRNSAVQNAFIYKFFADIFQGIVGKRKYLRTMVRIAADGHSEITAGKNTRLALILTLTANYIACRYTDYRIF